jgi:hypothetical protein
MPMTPQKWVLPGGWGSVLTEKSKFDVKQALRCGSKLDFIGRHGTVLPSDKGAYQILGAFAAVRVWC